MKRAHNFSAGPAVLPLPVLEKAQSELLNYRNTGASIIEMSHRGKAYTEINEQAKERLNRIMGLGGDFHILFLQGGASTQFMQVPLNFLSEHETADYINTGTWSTKAIKEARLFGKVNEVYSGKEHNFGRIPEPGEGKYTDNARYLHFTSNNTVAGTQFSGEPESKGAPLVCDASSDFLSRAIELDRYGLIYAGAQKNLGPAGVTVVLIRKDFLSKAEKKNIPTILDYKTHAEKLFNTPPVYAVYMVNLVLGWIEEQGGLAYFEHFNREKAELLYREIDADDFYRGTVEKNSRSLMNVTFRLQSEELEAKFIAEAAEQGIIGIKGHRSVGGMRASIYNACPMESVQALTAFMKQFRKENS